MIELIPRPTKRIETPHRRIVTSLPVPESIPLLETLREREPRSMACQLPTVWERAEGVQVYDPYGNVWLDWTSGVLTANAGHSPDAVIEAIHAQVDRKLLHAYVFPTRLKGEYLTALHKLVSYEKALLLSTGSEAIEAAVKIARRRGQDEDRRVVVSFDGAFHGRTMGAQAVGGINRQRTWLAIDAAQFVHLPYPARNATEFPDFASTINSLAAQGISPQSIAAVIFESYQGSTLEVAETTFAQELFAWCQQHGIAFIADEVQSGFGRTGKLFAFEWFDIQPDIVCCGKGLTGSVPLAAVLCSASDADRFDPGSMSSTHSGNPISLAAGLAMLQCFEDGTLVQNAARVGGVLQEGLVMLAKTHGNHLACARGLGLVGGLNVVEQGEPSASKARQIIEEAWRQGLLLFAPVGPTGSLVKVSPPLISTAEQISEAINVLDSVLGSI